MLSPIIGRWENTEKFGDFFSSTRYFTFSKDGTFQSCLSTGTLSIGKYTFSGNQGELFPSDGGESGIFWIKGHTLYVDYGRGSLDYTKV